MAEKQIENGDAFAKFQQFVAEQGGDISVLKDYSKFAQAPLVRDVCAQSEGYLCSMNTEQCGIASVELGAGREKKEDSIDFSAGIVLHKKVGDYIQAGEAIATFYTSSEKRYQQAAVLFEDAVKILPQAPEHVAMIHARVTIDGVENMN